MKPTTSFLLLLLTTLLLLIASSSFATRPVSSGSSHPNQVKHPKDRNNNQGSGGGGGIGDLFGPGRGFNIPGFGNGNGFGGGYGSGYGGPNGGHSKGGIIRPPSVVCKDKGPCYQKKLTCPAKCFSSFSRSGKGYGAGGGGGGCTMDCKKKCTASCA